MQTNETRIVEGAMAGDYENGVCEAILPGKKSARVHGCIKPAGHKGIHCNGKNIAWMPERIVETARLERSESAVQGEEELPGLVIGELVTEACHYSDASVWAFRDAAIAQIAALKQLRAASPVPAQPVTDCNQLTAASPVPQGASDGVSLIAAERERQIGAEGWTPEYDDEHEMGEMAGAAMSYAGHSLVSISQGEIDSDYLTYWAWDESWWKPSPDPIRNLVKAGALIAAEIDRLSRLRGEG